MRKNARASGAPAASAIRSDSRAIRSASSKCPLRWAATARQASAAWEYSGWWSSCASACSRSYVVRRLLGVAELDEIVDAPVQRERDQLARLEPLGDGQRLVDHREPLLDVIDVEQRGVAAEQRGGEGALVAGGARHRHRLGPQLLRAVAGVREREVLGEPRQQPRAQRPVRVAERGERLLEPADVGGVARGRHVEPAAGAEHRAGQRLGRGVGAGQLGGLVEGGAGARLARLPADVAERDQELGARERVVRPERDERLLEVPRALLIGVRGHGLAGCLGPVGDGPLRPADLAGGEEVVGELAGRRAGGLERLARAQVQPRPARGGGGVVERLAHERVPEGEVVDLRRVLDHDARAQGLLQRLEQLLPRPARHLRERGEPEVAAEHGGGRERLDGRRLQPREAARDEVLDALGQARLIVGRLGQAAQHLLDEERVAGGAVLERAGERGVADEDGGLRLAEPRQRDALHDLLAAEVGEQAGRAAGVGLGVAQGDEHQQRRAVQAADDVAQEQQRRAPRPLEVLDHEQQRPRRRGLPEQRGDRLEQPVTAVLALRGERRAVPAAELGHERREIGRRRGPARVGRVVAQRLHERLVGHDGLLVDAPVQDGRAARVGGGGEAGRQPRLAHARLPGEHDDAALRAPALVQHGQLGLAADERAAPPAARAAAGAGRPRPPRARARRPGPARARAGAR